MEPVTTQAVNFLLAVLIGLGTGLWFDVYRVVRWLFSPARRIIALLDFLWWLMVTALVFFILLYVTWGEVRFYLFLGQTLGAIIYFNKLSSTCIRLLNKMFRFTSIVILRSVQLILIPFRILKKIIYIPIAIIGLVFSRVFGWGKRLISFAKRVFRGIIIRIGNRLKKFFRRK